jgi:hypothetical protein
MMEAPKYLKIVQMNVHGGADTQRALLQVAARKDWDVIAIQEASCKQTRRLMSAGYEAAYDETAFEIVDIEEEERKNGPSATKKNPKNQPTVAQLPPKPQKQKQV